MKRIYEEYLHVPEDGKIRDKVFMVRIAVAIACVVWCLSAMGFSAYAFFTSSITSGSNTIVAATYGAEITVARDDNNPQTKVTPTVNQTIHTYSLVKGTYHVVIKATGNAQNGYCKIVIGDVESEDSIKYYTIQMNTDEKASKSQLEFVVDCYNDNAELHIIPNWGSCSEKEETKIGYDDSKKLIRIGNPTNSSGVSDDTVDTSSQQTPITTTKPTTQPATDSKEETQGSTSTSGEGTENSDSLQDSEISQDGEVSEGKSSDNVTDNSSTDHGNSEDTIPSEKVSE